MKSSFSRERSFFPLILCFILMLHIISLVFKVHMKPKDDANEDEKPLVVRLQNNRPDFKKQIVQSEDSKKREEKKDAFLSDKTRSFDRQTKARVNNVFEEGAKSGGEPRPSKKNIKLSDLGSLVADNPLEEAAKKYTDDKKGKPTKDPSRNVSSTNDHLKEIQPGDMTNLNTVEYKYYGFYHRIRQKLEQFWGRSIYAKAEEMAKEGRMVPASEELVTALQITLNSQGEVIDIKVQGSSGIQELDDAAVESFNEAGPFPNPPRDLVVNGKVTLEWGFVVNS